MIIRCIECHTAVADMPLDDAVWYIRWLDKTSEVPLCFRCTERAIINLYVQHASETEEKIKERAERAKQGIEPPVV